MHLVYSLSLAFLGLFDTNAVGARPQKLPLHKTLARRPPWMPVSKALQWADVHLIDGRSTTVAPDPSTLLSAKRVEQISIFLQPWLAIYRSLPKVVVPGLNLDIAFTLVCALIFTCIDYACAFVINSSLAWPWIESRAAAGSLTTIIHASVLVVGLLICLVTEPYSPSKRMDSHPLWWQDASSALIQLCTGYMLYDMIIQLLVDQWVPGTGLVLSTVNCLFIAHHLATTFYMTSARWLGSGHMSAMSLMLLGEVTAPIMNLRRLANAAVRLEEAASFAKQQQNLGWLVSLRPIINVVYAFLYIFFRAVAGPLCAVHLVYDLLCTRNGRKNVPMHVSIFWVALCGGVLVGSIPWIKETWQIVTGTLGTA